MAAETSTSATVPQPMTALLRTCRQISSEGKPIFWKQNALVFAAAPKSGNSWVPFPDVKFLSHVSRVLLDCRSCESCDGSVNHGPNIRALGKPRRKGASESDYLAG